MRVLLPWLLGFASLALAAPPGIAELGLATSRETYQIGLDQVEVVRYARQRLTISESCVRTEWRCQAYRTWKGSRGSFADRPKEEVPPPVLAAKVCVAAGGREVSGRDPAGDEEGFCRFSDSSVVGLGSLYSGVTRK